MELQICGCLGTTGAAAMLLTNGRPAICWCFSMGCKKKKKEDFIGNGLSPFLPSALVLSAFTAGRRPNRAVLARITFNRACLCVRMKI